jgi:DNA modification methylase
MTRKGAKQSNASTASVDDVITFLPQEFVARYPLADLAEFPGNPKEHDLGALHESIDVNGWYGAIVVQRATRRVLAGHGRRDALLAKGQTHGPVLLVDCDDRTARRIMLADNRLPTLGGFDALRLASFLSADAGDDNLRGTGYDGDDVDRLLADVANPPVFGNDGNDGDGGNGSAGNGAADGDGDEPVLVPPPTTPQSKPGIVYTLGRHRVVCGDATDPSHVALLLADARPDAVLMDPPYCSGGFQEAGKRGGSVGTRRRDGSENIANDRLSTRGYMALLRATFANLADVPITYTFTDWRMWNNLFDVVESKGFGVRNMIVWDKGTPGMGVGWRMQHELVMFGARSAWKFDPALAQGNVVRARRTGNIYHPTEKPVELLTKILAVTSGAEIIVDPMAGSGSTLLACEDAGKTAYCLELTPHYVDVIRQRYADRVGDPQYAPTGQLTDTAAK